MNANNQLKDFTCTDNYYKYFLGLIITDGVKELATRFECFWFIDIIASYQKDLKEEGFQSWTLRRKNQRATITCTNENDKILIKQEIKYRDFKPMKAIVWVEGNNPEFLY